MRTRDLGLRTPKREWAGNDGYRVTAPAVTMFGMRLKMRKWPSRSNPWWFIAIFTCLGLVAIVIGAWGARLAREKWFDDLWFEVAKAGVQVVAVGVLGGALTATWRDITAKRERDIERNEKTRAELVSLFDTYNGVKSVRRTIRRLGLDLKTYSDIEREDARRTAVLTKEQADGFHAQMLILNGLQLDFEAKARQFGQTNLLGEDTVQVVDKLGRIENHLNQALQLWEKSGWTIREGTPLRQVSDGLEQLLRVREQLRPNVSVPLREITEVINKHVFGEASPSTKSALDQALSKHQERDHG